MIFLIDLPEPTHGMANVNLHMLSYANDIGLECEVFNTVPSRFAKFFPSKKWMMFKGFHTAIILFKLACKLWVMRKQSIVVYRAINGGSGQAFDNIYILMCYLFSCEMIIHHHSFQYFHKKTSLFSFMTKMLRGAKHVVLGREMKHKLIELYGVDKNQVCIISNIVFTDIHEIEINTPHSSQSFTIGYLSNISAEKGLNEFLEICADLNNRGITYQAHVAGPFMDSESRAMVFEFEKRVNNFKYFGPLYGQDKDNYYSGLDAFVFPSKYVNEAEPLVLYEAGSYGAYLIGTKTGCIESVIQNLGGTSFAYGASFVQEVTTQLIIASDSGLFGRDKKQERVSAMKLQKSKGLVSLESLFSNYGE